MDPLSITTPSLSIAIGVTRVTDAIVHFSRESKHAADDLSRISSELTALSSVLDPLSQKLLSEETLASVKTKMANISVRRHIRWIPASASEPTSTIVLTSPGRHFVDIRILVGPGPEAGRLDWAFAGSSNSERAQEAGVRHAVWRHWVDSSTADAATVRDEAEVREAVDDSGTELETGRMVNPATGLEADYEETWVSVEAVGTGSHSGSSPPCAVVRVCDDERQVRGMVVRVGQFCQGILRVGDAVTAERWEWRSDGGWALSARFGEERLPVEMLLEDMKGLVVGGIIEDSGRSWDILEAEGGSK